MIIAEWKPLSELTERLKKHRKVLVAGCSTCVAECSAGGEKEVHTMAPLLEIAMKKNDSNVVVHEATVERQCEWEFLEELEEVIPRVDAVVSLACGIGVQALAERYPDVPVYPGVNTTSLAIREEPGLWTARCAACGDCMLGDTFGLCPVARCAKGLLNGPCGGTRPGGKCEINEETDCIWYLIIRKAQERGQMEALMRLREPKDWSKSIHNGPKRMVREDLR